MKHTSIHLFMGKDWVTFASNFYFRPQAPQKLPHNPLRYGETFSGKMKFWVVKSYTPLSQNFEVDLSDFTSILSSNDKISSKPEIKSMLPSPGI